MLLFSIALALTLLTALLFHCDDLFLDAYNFFKGLRPSAISPQELKTLRSLPQRRAAILIPSWKETEIARMVRGNLATLDYQNVSVFIGVYPNDHKTWETARQLEKTYPHLSVVVNHKPGPTSKAQLLNEMIRQILQSEEISGFKHELFVVHDAEDVMHPSSLLLLNRELEKADFIQLPVLSQPVHWRKFAAGTYADESAEAHLRDLLARDALGAALPASGAGMALSRTLIKALRSKGDVFSETNAAENYQLGLESGSLGFRSRFISAYLAESKDFIATRKIFPEKTEGAIRQKARWTTGIAFQSAFRFGWGRSLADKYFFWRDRRGPWTTILLAVASCLFLISAFQGEGEPPILPRWAEILSMLNAALWVRRVSWRMRTTAWVYGWVYALFVPVRWPVANFINSLSTWRAVSIYSRSLRTGESPSWAERTRRLPEGFGL